MPVEAARESGGERQVSKREVLGAWYFRASRNLVVEREVSRCRHDIAPTSRVQVSDVFVDAVHVFVYERLKRNAAVVPVLVEREVVALAEVVAEPRVAEILRQLCGNAVSRDRIDAGRVESARFRLLGEIVQAIVALPEL